MARSEQACARLINTFRIKSFSPLIKRTADEGRQLAEESDYRAVPSDHKLIEISGIIATSKSALNAYPVGPVHDI